MNGRFEALNTHAKKLETQVVQTSEAERRHEALIKGKFEAGQKHCVSTIIDDDFWQVVKHEKLQEEDFQVESFMSFGSMHWCRSTPLNEHRSTPSAEYVDLERQPVLIKTLHTSIDTRLHL